MEKDFLKDLNKAQYIAAVNTEGPSLVIAGAGSGKTRVLTYRIAYLLSKSIKPGQILALTFTNKAAGEMKERIGKLVGEEPARYLWMGTFHSIFARILRYEAEFLGYNYNYSIYDTTDSKSLVKSIVRELNLDEQIYKPGEVFGRISSAKNNLITAQAYNNNQQILDHDRAIRRERIGDIYRIYASRCKKANAMDFDDLLLNTNILFRDFPEVLQKYQERFSYILVDEYQDTNYCQYLIVNKLSAIHRNVCVVGDDAQSIYSFRGAKIENILNFRNDYPVFNLYKLEQNYRSTQTIVNAANSIIEKNKGQIHKKVWSKNDLGEKLKVVETLTDNEEGFVISNSILDTQLTERQLYSDFAILYRTNAQSRIFEESLRKKNIPYKIYGSISFYQRKEIKDVLAYLRLIVNLHDDEALKRIINYPARGIGNVTQEKLESYAADTGISIWQVLGLIESSQLALNSGTVKKLVHFRNMIEEFQSMSRELDAYDLAQNVASKSGVLKDLYNGQTVEERSKIENIEELLNAIREFTEEARESNEKIGIDKYLENVSLLTDMDNEKAEDRNKVTIMTMHSAKGLEFNNVYIAGCEERLFPSLFSSDNPQDLEEERRLFYVAVTRARKKVMITYSRSRYRWGVPTDCEPSRFISEIDPQYIDWPQQNRPGAFVFDDADVEGKPFFRKRMDFFKRERLGSQSTLPGAGNKAAHHTPDPDFRPDNPDLIKIGMKIEHQRFGYGKVIHLEGTSRDRKATVFFQSLGQEKQLLLKFARLRIVKAGESK
ncbi:MAG TPA: UvrD-helicase domain-containing protein [Bacteroidales bacterium]|nr:UvrD-helicase domain-containing protein [Bacteroidales bacterium]